MSEAQTEKDSNRLAELTEAVRLSSVPKIEAAVGQMTESSSLIYGLRTDSGGEKKTQEVLDLIHALPATREAAKSGDQEAIKKARKGKGYTMAVLITEHIMETVEKLNDSEEGGAEENGGPVVDQTAIDTSRTIYSGAIGVLVRDPDYKKVFDSMQMQVSQTGE